MTTMAHENDKSDEMRALRTRNIRTGLILAAIVVVLFVSFIARTWYLGHG